MILCVLKWILHQKAHDFTQECTTELGEFLKKKVLLANPIGNLCLVKGRLCTLQNSRIGLVNVKT